MSQHPLPWGTATQAVGHCIVRSSVMLARGEVHLPREWVGRRVAFGDGSTGRVYRETAVDARPVDTCVLDVCFRLRGVRGAGHALFERESLLNTPLFVGFPGFATKLWVAHDDNGTYRGLYEWDGAARADAYARALWRVLQLVSVPDSIHFQVLPGIRREEVFARVGGPLGPAAGSEGEWWEVVGVE
ncbi:MAG: hypothetical protein L0H79_06090 [Intrasporangium sp.]|uniref:hypothetical protein n=1 Tax=Intrasporangium sp. TaxID=1925024 RepID=UPI00264907DB|nr:hypothetical protein [Intrasporangium sp.]MDN5795309.1 hypothetical protein [Intrasporangium sp.]